MILINLTPHKITIGEREIKPAGIIARCQEITDVAGVVDGVELVYRNYGKIEDLPQPKPNVMYLVSHIIRVAAKERLDVASPGDAIRDEDGKIIGCTNLIVNKK